MSNYLWGADLSLKCTGITIYDLDKHEFVYTGSFNTEKIYATKENKGLYLNGVKLKKMVDWFKILLKTYPPTEIAIERGYSHHNNETQAIFRVHGVFNCLFWNIPQTYYPPKSVKAAILHGDATKKELADYINITYNDIKFSNDDESDSFAVALTYMIEKGIIQWEKPVIEKKPRKPRKKKTT